MNCKTVLLKLSVSAFLLSTLLITAAQQRPAADTTQKAVLAANAFLATLDSQQRTTVKLALNETTRANWSNLPSAPGFTSMRNGIRMAELTAAQQDAALALVASTLSDSGYQKVMNIIRDEEARLRPVTGPQLGARIRFDSAEYQIAILGEPSTTQLWMIQFGGHHLALNITLVGTHNVITPSHTGVDPARYTFNGQIVRPLGKESDKAFALINALRPEQQREAVLPYKVADTVLGPNHDGAVIQPEGVRGSSLDAKQQEMLADLISEWVTILNDASAGAKMAEIRSAIGNTYFAWSGPTTDGSAAYFRIQGPTVQIEYAPQNGGTNHIHTFYRDPTNDYGAKFLKP